MANHSDVKIELLTHMKSDELQSLCTHINMMQEATDEVISVAESYDFTALESLFKPLMSIETANQAFLDINALLEGNPQKGFVWLAVTLSGALIRQDICREMGISDEIFYDTMGCLSRFVKEHKASYGVYGFDRQFWSYRQLCGVLYRIGTLEFEMVDYIGETLYVDGEDVLPKGAPMISVHIPSDASIDREHNHASYTAAVDFLQRFYPEFRYHAFYCSSWLMAPNLQKVLPSESKILQFQSDYKIADVKEDDQGYILWVYKKSGLTVDEFCEDTSLQRNIKTHVKCGGKIGAATGVIQVCAGEALKLG